MSGPTDGADGATGNVSCACGSAVRCRVVNSGSDVKGVAGVTVVVTNYQTADLALRCISACLALDGDRLYEVLVVDDASPDGPPAVDNPKVRLIVNQQNIGLVRSLNRALGEVLTDLVVIFDSDAEPLTPFVEETREVFANPRMGLVAFSTVAGDGTATESFCREPGLSSLLLGQRLAHMTSVFRSHGGSMSVFTCAMAARMSAVRDVGGFDEHFDWLDLDHDMSMAMTRRAWELQLLPSVVALHEGGGTPQEVSNRVLRFYKNRWLLLMKYGKIRRRRLVKWGIIVRLAAEWLVLLVAGRILVPNQAARQDRIGGRIRTISYCFRNY